MIIPRYYLAELQGISDKMQSELVVYDNDAYQKIKRIYVLLAQLVMRRHKESEEERMTILDQQTMEVVLVCQRCLGVETSAEVRSNSWSGGGNQDVMPPFFASSSFSTQST